MVHGFLILTHFAPGKVLAQVTRLAAPTHRFFIHFDKKKKLDENDPALQKLMAMPGVEVMSERVNVQWASSRMVDATLILIRAAVKHRDIQYLHLLSGECLHVKSLTYLDEFLQEGNNQEYLEYFPIPETIRDGWGPWRYDRYHMHEYFNQRSKAVKDVVVRNLNLFLNRGQGLLKRTGIYRKFPAEFPRLYGGSQWWSVTFACGAYMLDYLEQNPVFLRRFQHTSCPDEIFFQTLIMASPFATQVVNNNLRHIVFSDGPHAGALTMNDIKELRAPHILFARKFTDRSAELLNYLEAHVYNTTK